MQIKNLDIQIKAENIMRAADCRPNSPAYPFVLAEYEKYSGAAKVSVSLSAWIDIDEAALLCSVIISAGETISALSSKLFAEGRATAGLLVSVTGDEYVFEADKAVSDIIKKECARRGLGVKRRLEAPVDMPLERQREIIKRTGADVSLTEGFQFRPEKTIGYILELTRDSAVFNAQHDCSKCTVRDCPRRVKDVGSSFEVLSEHGQAAAYQGCALCVDIGTTTIAGTLIDNGMEIQVFRSLNPQRRFGADVLSRIEAAERGRLRELHQLIVFELMKFVSQAKKAPDKIIISANTAMVHLLMGWSCSGLGAYPFSPVSLETVNTDLKALGGNIDIPVTIIGGISAFVGGDISSGIYSCGITEKKELSLFADLGTNAEMAVGNSERLLVTSAAAGPAFEGGGISCGCGSVPGAVCGVDLKSGELRTIGNKTPSGICGTGIIELVSELLDADITDKTGLLCDKYFESGYPVTENISFTQKDMRALQTAKSAVISGIETLLLEYGASMDDIETVYLSGGFGNGLDLSKAENIGLLPRGTAEKAVVLGNSSLGGAVKYSGDDSAEDAISRIKAISTDILLGENEYFSKRYIENMSFM